MLSIFLRPLAVGACCLAFASASVAQTPAPVSLRAAVDAAWNLSPQARSQQNRLAELDARRNAAASWFSGPPALTLAHRTDSVGTNEGLREMEAEISAPVWSPAVRRATSAQVDAERNTLELQVLRARAALAADVRDLAAQLALARIERDVVQRKLQDAQQLASDIKRRVDAGEVARVDHLQALAAQHQSSTALAQTEAALNRLQAQWAALTGLASVASLEETESTQSQPHPEQLAAEAQLRSAQANLDLTAADRRDPIELGVGMTRERPTAGAASERSIRFVVRIPFGSESRNAPKLALARAEVDEAQAQALAAARTVDAERNAAQAELAATRSAQSLAAEREALAREVHGLIAKSYQLGESDLQIRLRAEAERFDAELSHARARVETQRAISKLNQAFGVLP